MKTINKIASMLTLTGAMLLSFSCEKKEENLIAPVENNKEEAVEVVVTEAEPMVEEPAPVQLPETRLSLNEEHHPRQ